MHQGSEGTRHIVWHRDFETGNEGGHSEQKLFRVSKSQENYKPKGNVRQASIYESTQPQKHKSTAVAQYIKAMSDPVHEPWPPLLIDIDEFIRNLERLKDMGVPSATPSILASTSDSKSSPNANKKRKSAETELPSSSVSDENRGAEAVQDVLSTPGVKRQRVETQKMSSSSVTHNLTSQRIRLKIEPSSTESSSSSSLPTLASSDSIQSKSVSKPNLLNSESSKNNRTLPRGSARCEMSSYPPENEESRKDTRNCPDENQVKKRKPEKLVEIEKETKENQQVSTMRIEEIKTDKDVQNICAETFEQKREKSQENPKETTHEDMKERKGDESKKEAINFKEVSEQGGNQAHSIHSTGDVCVDDNKEANESIKRTALTSPSKGSTKKDIARKYESEFEKQKTTTEQFHIEKKQKIQQIAAVEENKEDEKDETKTETDSDDKRNNHAESLKRMRNREMEEATKLKRNADKLKTVDTEKGESVPSIDTLDVYLLASLKFLRVSFFWEQDSSEGALTKTIGLYRSTGELFAFCASCCEKRQEYFRACLSQKGVAVSYGRSFLLNKSKLERLHFKIERHLSTKSDCVNKKLHQAQSLGSAIQNMNNTLTAQTVSLSSGGTQNTEQSTTPNSDGSSPPSPPSGSASQDPSYYSNLLHFVKPYVQDMNDLFKALEAWDKSNRIQPAALTPYPHHVLCVQPLDFVVYVLRELEKLDNSLATIPVAIPPTKTSNLTNPRNGDLRNSKYEKQHHQSGNKTATN